MLKAVYIFVDDDFGSPLYADPDPGDVDEGLWTAVCERVNDALEGEGATRGVAKLGDVDVGWRTLTKSGISFVALTSEVRQRDLETYLRSIAERYFDEVDDVRQPGRHGVEDVVIDVIPPWDD